MSNKKQCDCFVIKQRHLRRSELNEVGVASAANSESGNERQTRVRSRDRAGQIDVSTGHAG
ncbi:MAG: hypothetical protein DMF74_24590 [Acidobacteria bacterium]|nr:MAG: hypothetical protein DMF74_24590 [Acidobacteriota bacterium]